MKFFFVILSFFMLFLSCLPCGDSTECTIKAEEKFAAANDHQQHHHDAESCTPFCTCSCCASASFFMPVSKNPLEKATFIPLNYPLFDISVPSEDHRSIWQPPKLA